MTQRQWIDVTERHLALENDFLKGQYSSSGLESMEKIIKPVLFRALQRAYERGRESIIDEVGGPLTDKQWEFLKNYKPKK